MNSTLFLRLIFLLAITSVASAHSKPPQDDNAPYIQSIHVTNLLANTGIADTGMTPTPIIVKYYNGSPYPCWSSMINYHDDDTVHAGPYLGCSNKIYQVVIMPIVIADRLKTYAGPISVNIDITKYSDHILVFQDTAPIFDTQSGLVATQGTIKVQIQTERR